MKRACGLGVRLDVAHQLAGEIAYGGENTTCDHFALDACEPDLDLIQPGRVGRCEMQFHRRMVVEKRLDLLRLVGGKKGLQFIATTLVDAQRTPSTIVSGGIFLTRTYTRLPNQPGQPLP